MKMKTTKLQPEIAVKMDIGEGEDGIVETAVDGKETAVVDGIVEKETVVETAVEKENSLNSQIPIIGSVASGNLASVVASGNSVPSVGGIPVSIATNMSNNHETRLPKTILARMFSSVNIGHLRFIIMDCPTTSTLDDYLKELLMRGCTDVVRLCEPTYDKSVLMNNNINVHDWPFKDGSTPPSNIIQEFHSLCSKRFSFLQLEKSVIADRKVTIVANPSVIAVHCVAGLGRAPVLVATSLIEAGFSPTDAIEFIRNCRRGAFNATQLKYLMDDYKRRSGFKAFNFLKRSSTPPAPPPATAGIPPSASSSAVGSQGREKDRFIDNVFKVKVIK